MGVHGLWDLLAPVGRRVSVETLAGRRLAIDASIWMVQFMKAMRDEKGEMIRNAHLVGFFRRICKLLFLRTKPVFVFDGGTPALKRRTVVARRRQREKAQAKFRKTAEKLLLNQLKAMRLKELAESLENQKLTKVAKGKKVMLDQSDSLENNVTKETCNVEKMDELLAASLAAEDCDGYPGTASVSGYGTGSFDGSASTSVEVHLDEDNEDDEEMILPIGNGGVDPAVLAALPPSMQLDLLVQMRERLMAENRQKYQRVKKAPQRFSELQIESYLKTVAFRREIDEVQKAAAGKGINGMHTSRIASEANREFIFSSSFTGDKQELVSSGVTKKDKRQEQTGKDCSFFDLLSLDGSAVKSHPETTSAIDEPEVGTNDVVQTYLDERGHVRVSRVRAMGIRMTRDLQRNLDLMRELEQERPTTNATELVQFDPREKVSVDLGSSEGRKRCLETAEACSHENDFLSGTNSLSAVGRHTHEPAEIGNTIEISFVDNDDQKSSEDVEGLFADLVAGKPMMFSTIGDSQPIVHTSDPALDCEWEEGLVGEEPDNVTNAHNMEVDAFQVDGFNDKVIELDWEEGMPDSRKDVHLSPGACEKCPSKGSLEEDLALQEAIRRSLEDFAAGISITVPSESEKIEEVVDHTSSQLLRQENEIAEPSFQIVNNIQVRGTLGLLGDESDDSSLNTYVDDVSGEPLTSSTVSTSHDMRDMTDCPKSLCSPDNQNRAQDVGSSSFLREIVETKSVDVADVDLNESNSHAAPMCPSNKASDVAMHHEESTMEQPVSDTHLKSQLADENCPDLVQEIKDDDMICAVESSEGDDVEFKKTCLEDELQDLSREYIILGEVQRKLERNAESVNSEMFVECQELLQMFGLPYIIAPMEAEAQCAFMERAKLVDGVVTDDSDVFLFGARSVYKNIFDNRKYVETYFMKDIEDDLGLDQEKLIRMALLLGSDYTEGISGIGIVNAIEVIHAFPDEDGLSKFREWIESPDPMILGKLGMKSTTELSDNGSSFVETDPEGPPVGDFNDLPGTMDSQTESNGQKLRQFFMDKHRKVSKNWHVPSSFPSEAVISAYRSPQVDKSSDPFSWGKPDLFALRRLCWEKFGWGGPKADELLLPVLKEYNKHETQLRLEAFYTFNERFAKIRSKRIKQAVKGITKNQSTKLTGETDTGQDAFYDIQKRTVRSTHRINKRKTPKDNASGISDHSVEHKKSQPRKRRAQEIGTGRRKAKIRGNPQAVATGRRKSNSASECAETSSSDADHIDDLEHGMLAGTPQGPCNIRKSMRPRKAANYVECDVEIDESLYLNKCQANCSRAELVEEQLSYDAAGSFAVEPPVGEDSLVTDGLSKDYLVQGGGFCADEDEVETGEAQWCSLLHNDGASCDTEMDHVQVCGTFTDDGAIRNEHECDPSETATEATKIVNPSLCFSEAQMCENNSIERKLIESSRGSLERVQQPKHINEEDEDDQHLIWNDNLSRRDNRGHRSSKTDDQTGVKASSTDNCGHRNSKSDDQTGVKVKASSTMPNSRRNKRMRSSPEGPATFC